ncbi:hypothetical protein PCASD_13695 [Puccinia coronata f. sp. avenae]|uniref:DNA helicase Pif1-like 2B domain-containing protein n=1 Tax=Puccinia coronata f. sp. avenae TaxID=200324 RepID=A0A2N5UC05_9BASI|nr:hypothetical protein PCASD_13695 [Puccinia coronata f. sp. avenae]
MGRLLGKAIELVSIDTPDPDGFESLPEECLNMISVSGLPEHPLLLKVGMPVVVTQNLNIAGGICNGTRLLIKDLSWSYIKCLLMTVSGDASANAPEQQRQTGADPGPEAKRERAAADSSWSTQDKTTEQLSEPNRKRARPLCSRITQETTQDPSEYSTSQASNASAVVAKSNCKIPTIAQTIKQPKHNKPQSKLIHQSTQLIPSNPTNKQEDGINTALR